MVVSMKMNMVLQKSDSMLNRERNYICSFKSTSISCMAKELPMHNDNLYKLLSLESRNVSFNEIKKAYRAKALQLHPDVCPSSITDECTKQFVELHKAYEVLSDPNTRRMYDQELNMVECFGSCGSGHQFRFYDRKVWEMQLAGLKKRSADRMERMKNEFM
ncbi:unnamed protein product [Lactuca virosa]|uniref:J domain-containing protein n=1 Tax=Lactuca virosa TaxID=75947 RepID=A0AAU9MKG6_9ASTR|nr:unnamed protein product [Lactuca virosa]